MFKKMNMYCAALLNREGCFCESCTKKYAAFKCAKNDAFFGRLTGGDSVVYHEKTRKTSGNALRFYINPKNDMSTILSILCLLCASFMQMCVSLMIPGEKRRQNSSFHVS